MRRAAKILTWSFIGAAFVVAAFAVWLAFPGSPDSGAGLAFEGFVALPKGPGAGLITVLDYLTIDRRELFVTSVSTGRVYKIAIASAGLPAKTDVTAIDLEPAAHGVVLDPQTGLAFATRSEANEVAVFDPVSLQLRKSIAVADDPDGIFYLATERRIYVANGDAKIATLIDPAKSAVAGTIALGGKPEFGAFDRQSRLFYQNIEDLNAVAAVDVSVRKVVKRWALDKCIGPTGMAIDANRRLLFIGCGGSSSLVAFSLAARRVVAALPVGGGPDSVGYDEALHRIYVTGRSGVLSVVQETEQGGLAEIGRIRLRYGAHTLAVDPRSHKLYVGYASFLTGPRVAVFTAVKP